MASENLNRWINTYDMSKTSIYMLESCSVFLFQTKDIVHTGPVIGNEDPLGRLPMYHVWDNDKEIYVGTDYKLV